MKKKRLLSRNEPKTYTEQQLGEFINNIVVLCSRAETIADKVSERRLRKLREYSQELIRLPLVHIDKGWFSYEEMRLILANALFFFHAQIGQNIEQKLPVLKETD